MSDNQINAGELHLDIAPALGEIAQLRARYEQLQRAIAQAKSQAQSAAAAGDTQGVGDAQAQVAREADALAGQPAPQRQAERNLRAAREEATKSQETHASHKKSNDENKDNIRRHNPQHPSMAMALQTRSISSLGAFATSGDFGSLGRSFADAMIREVLLGGTRRGAARAAAAGAGGAGGLVGMIASNPVVAIIGAIAAATIGAAIGINKLQASFAADAQSLTSSVGGLGPGGSPQQASNLNHIAANYGYDLKTGQQIGNQLGVMGVTGDAVPALTKLAASLGKITGLPPGQMAGLAGNMAQGGMGSPAIVDFFSSLKDLTGKTTLSFTKLLDDMATLGLGKGTVSPAGLVTAQQFLNKTNSGLDAYSVVAPLRSAFGLDRVAMAGMLGTTPESIQRVQGRKDPAGMLGLVATALKPGGTFGSSGMAAGESMMSKFLAIPAGTDAGVVDTLYKSLLTSNLGAQESAWNAVLRADTRRGRVPSITATGQHVADVTTDVLTKARLQLEASAKDAANGLGNGSIRGASYALPPQYGPHGQIVSERFYHPETGQTTTLHVYDKTSKGVTVAVQPTRTTGAAARVLGTPSPTATPAPSGKRS